MSGFPFWRECITPECSLIHCDGAFCQCSGQVQESRGQWFDKQNPKAELAFSCEKRE